MGLTDDEDEASGPSSAKDCRMELSAVDTPVPSIHGFLHFGVPTDSYPLKRLHVISLDARSSEKPGDDLLLLLLLILLLPLMYTA